MKKVTVCAWALCLVAVVATLNPPSARGCAAPTPDVVSGPVQALLQEPAADTSAWTPDFPGAILELQGPAGPLRFRLSRNIGMTLAELRDRAQNGRPVKVKYETLYDGRLRALEIVGVERKE